MNISEDHGFARSDDPVDPLYKQPFRYAEPKNGLLPALTVGEDLAIYHMTWPTVACARHAMSELATRRCTKTPEARHGRVHERASRAKQVVTPADQVHSYCARQLLVSMICKKSNHPLSRHHLGRASAATFEHIDVLLTWRKERWRRIRHPSLTW